MPDNLDTFSGEGDLIPDSQRPSRRPTVVPGGEVDDDNERLSRASAAAISLPDEGRGSTLPGPAPAPDFQDEGAGAVVGPNKPAAKPGSTTIDIPQEQMQAYLAELARLAPQYQQPQGTSVQYATVTQGQLAVRSSTIKSVKLAAPPAHSVASSWASSLPPRESNSARNLMVGGALALATVGGGVWTWLSIGSSEVDRTPAAVTAATSAQASAVLDPGTAPVPATSASANVPAAKK